ncbi:MAG: penicillin-binding protein 2 [Alphaproteobacteria bacterium]|nr:penicillin-binding protein 2 [Alphaproteobacteria bacterium]
MQGAPALQQRRIVVGAVLCAMAFVLVGARLADVTLMKTATEVRTEASLPVSGRADIVDRNGNLLARDLPVKDLYARPHAFWDRNGAAHDLSRVTGANESRLLAGFSAAHPYVLVARQLTPDVEDRVMHLGLPGLEFEPSAKRFYPNGRATAQVLGVTDPDNAGLSGLELGLDGALKRGQDAQALATSLDTRVQYILAHEVDEARKSFSAAAAGGIVMDVRSGEVLGLVSLPDFDPNQRDMAGSDSERNILVQDVYELGSIFKIFAFSLALEDRTTNPDEVFPIGQGFKIGKYTIHEAEHMPATLAARDVLALSSNIGTAQIALRSGPERQRAFLARLGLLSPMRTELPELARPLLPAHWGTIETATIGFGHGISVSPLSFVAAAAAIVNGGRKVVPTFLKRPGDARGIQLIRPETSAEMRTLLRYVVTDGTGKKADVAGYDVGGKTGSAEKPGPHGYQAHKLVTSFCAVFPIDAPRYLVFVILDEPHGTRETNGFALAGYTAAPTAGRVISRIAPLLGISPRIQSASVAHESS